METRPARTRKHSPEAIIESAASLASLLIENKPKAALLPHLHQLLSVLIWKVTEAEGKGNVRYWSEGYKNNPNGEWEHEHVFERKKLIRQMVESKVSPTDVFQSAIACLVTESEHASLSAISRDRPTLEGWERYRAAGIRVWDRQKNKFLW